MRKVKDAIDLSNDEKIYFKGHAKATYLSDGRTVEDAINNISVVSSEANVKAVDIGETIDGVVINYAEISYVDEKDIELSTRIKALEEIDHVKLVEDASAAAITAIVDNAPEKFDTLKEIAAWISEADTADDAASLVTRVKALEEIDHDAYKAYVDEIVGNINVELTNIING